MKEHFKKEKQVCSDFFILQIILTFQTKTTPCVPGICGMTPVVAVVVRHLLADTAALRSNHDAQIVSGYASTLGGSSLHSVT